MYVIVFIILKFQFGVWRILFKLSQELGVESTKQLNISGLLLASHPIVVLQATVHVDKMRY